MPTILSADVEVMLHLLSTAGDPATVMSPAERKRAVLAGVASLVAADVWIWMAGQANSQRPGDAVPVTMLDGGWLDDQERTDALRVITHPGLAVVVTGPLDEAIRRKQSVVRLRQELFGDDAWQTAPAGQAWRSVGFAQFMLAVRPLTESTYSALGFHRRLGKPAFTDRERRILRLFVEQVTWLHRAKCDVPAAGGVVDLSPRLRQIVLLLMGGDSRKRIATKLRLSEYTVADYLKTIYRKLGVSSRSELLAMFIGANGQPVLRSATSASLTHRERAAPAMVHPNDQPANSTPLDLGLAPGPSHRRRDSQ